MRNVTKFILILFIALLGSTISLFAQEFKSSVDKITVGENERFRVYFAFENGNSNEVRNFRGPDFEGFRILGGPNQSTSMQIINGKMSGSVTFSYVLQATTIGKYTIGSATLSYQGKEFKTNPLVIQVVKGSSTANQQSNPNGGISNEELAKNVFIRAISDKSSAYQGEQITVTYKLYVKTNINSPSINKLPTYKGFWSEDLEDIQNIRFQQEMYKGERFRTAVIKRVALFPTQSGSLTVTPFELNVPVIVRKKRTGNSVFDDFFNDSFFGRSEAVDFVAKSNQLKINVKELPGNSPESFKGAVGKFKLNAGIDSKEVEQNGSVTVKVDISGQGNIKLLDVPEIKIPVGFEKYDPKTSENIVRKTVISGTKKVEYLLVPRIPGEKVIPAVEFSYFDINSKKYVTLKSDDFKINVLKGDNTYSTPTAGFTKEDVKLLNEDIRFIKISSFNLQLKGTNVILSLWFWLSLILPTILLAVVLLIKKRNDKLSGNVQLLKSQKAQKAAKNRLKSAKKAMDAADNETFYNEISLALFGYLEDKLAIQKSDFTLDKALTELKSRNVSEELSKEVKAISEKCEFARFAPNDGSGKAEHDLYDKTLKVIVELENSITSRKK